MITRKGSAGGKVMAIVQRQDAITKYYKSPNICLNCNKVIDIKDGEKVSTVRRRRFCNRSCAAIFNNKRKYPKVVIGKCEDCGCEIRFERGKKGNLKKRKYCKSCLREIKARTKGANTYIANLTKDQVMSRYAKYYIGRNMIRKHAKSVFEISNKERQCVVCGYDKHVDIAHIKSVSEFNGDTLISVINHKDNLMALCPNHHWEHDNGQLKI